MTIRYADCPRDIASAAAIDEAVAGSSGRAAYIRAVAEREGLFVAAEGDDIRAFCCLDHLYFFGKPFMSLLVVAPEARRLGFGSALLGHAAGLHTETWTSTNRSNTPMRGLLDAAGWRFCGEIRGLDAGDPERFYRAVSED